MRAFVIGNGSSLKNTPMEKLIGERTYACNQIWRYWQELRPETKWRPTDYVRGEPWVQDGDAVVRDLRIMKDLDVRIWIPVGFYRFIARLDVAFGRPAIPYLPCIGKQHNWHLDLGDYICAYGTSVQVAMQLAVLEGADSIYLVGCDLGNGHFYNENGVDIDERNINAHEMARISCPVPIYNATIGGNLEVYPRVQFEELFK